LGYARDVPLIQYATTSDSVSIAFWTLGSGPPAIFLPALPFANLQVEWEMPAYRRWFERLAERRTVIHYDSRGTGLSDRDVPDLSLDAHLSIPRPPHRQRRSNTHDWMCGITPREPREQGGSSARRERDRPRRQPQATIEKRHRDHAGRGSAHRD